MKLTTWLKERELNCRRLGAGKTGSDRAGWIDDADHFQSALAEIERLTAEAVKSERRAIEYGDIVHKQVLAMRAAVVAWQREGAEIGMKWIANTLAGPGHLPSDEDTALGAQPLFDKEVAEHEAFRAAHPAP